MSYLLDFTNPAANATDCSGGKGANLALLTQRGFPVPPGFVITAAAYRAFVAAADGFAVRVGSLPVADAPRRRAESETLLLQSLSLSPPATGAGASQPSLAEAAPAALRRLAAAAASSAPSNMHR